MRRLIAALACRVQGSRLYGKPVQNLVTGTTILDQILDTIDTLSFIETPILGISEGIENQVFVEIAKARGIPYIFGDEVDVLSRLIACGRVTKATDVFRVTTECPFMYYEAGEEAWRRHLRNANDVTTVEPLPEGALFEIYTLDALEQSHARGTAHHRSEGCSRYIREHRGDFRVEIIAPAPECGRTDIRLTVDYPEDLVLCRRIYEHFQALAPLIPLAEILKFLDANPGLHGIVQPYVSETQTWLEADPA